MHYTCTTTSTGTLDLCTHSDVDFDSTTGRLVINTIDVYSLPMGTYELEISASTGQGPTVQVIENYKIIMVHPCSKGLEEK